jgi:hypothetical protein
MRYLVLLFFAIVLLNEPTISVTVGGHASAGDQVTCCSSSPADLPTARDQLVSSPNITIKIVEQDQISPADEVSPEVSRRVWYRDSQCSSSTASPHSAYPAVIQERMRLLCFGQAETSHDYDISTLASLTTIVARLFSFSQAETDHTYDISTLASLTAGRPPLPNLGRSQEAVPRRTS